MVLLAIVVLCFQVVSSFSPESSCRTRDYGEGSVVCVCDSNYCDTVPPIEPVTANEAVVFLTDKGGRRFERKVVTKKKFKKTEASVNIIVDPSKKYQVIEGFGGFIHDSAAMNILNSSSKIQDAIFKSYFSKDGIEYNILRVVISSTDGSTHPYSYDDVANDFNLTHFALVEEDTKFKIPVLQTAQKYAPGPILLFASSWSAPAWMKTNGHMNGNGSLKGAPTKSDQYYNTWAKYYVRFLEEYSKHGIYFWAITAQNEPTVGFAEGKGWQTQRFTAEMQRDFIKYNLGPALAESAFKNVSIMILDDNRWALPAWAQTVLSDSEVKKYVSHVAVHFYSDGNVPPDVLDQVHDEYPDISILATEASLINQVLLGNWDQAETYAQDVIEDLNHWSTGWVVVFVHPTYKSTTLANSLDPLTGPDWQGQRQQGSSTYQASSNTYSIAVEWAIAVDTDGGPSWADNHVNAPIMVNVTAGEIYKQPTFYALGHFRKSTDVDVAVSEAAGKENIKITLPAKSIATLLWK